MPVNGELSIRLPDDETKQQALRGKLDEYKGRLRTSREEDPYKPPELFGVYYAIMIMEALLEKGELNYGASTEEVKETGGVILRHDVFDNYFQVIEDYANTGGANLSNPKKRIY